VTEVLDALDDAETTAAKFDGMIVVIEDIVIASEDTIEVTCVIIPNNALPKEVTSPFGIAAIPVVGSVTAPELFNAFTV
jgi:hypothetical protein